MPKLSCAAIPLGDNFLLSLTVTNVYCALRNPLKSSKHIKVMQAQRVSDNAGWRLGILREDIMWACPSSILFSSKSALRPLSEK